MAKKGQAVQLQIEVETDEDWNKLVERRGLIVVDVYSEWCGPCTGMVGNLRKLKLDIGGDILTLAIAKADGIKCLERFRNKSEPTWMFVADGRMIRLMFGTNAPRLITIITDELAKTKKSMEDDIPREGIDFDQLTPEEQERFDEENRIVEEAARIEAEARERERYERRLAVMDNLVPNIREYNLIILFPKNGYDEIMIVQDHMNSTNLSTVGKQVKKLLTENDVYEIQYFSDWPLESQAVAEMTSGECTGICYQVSQAFDHDLVIKNMCEIVYGVDAVPPGTNESLAYKLQYEIEKEESIVEEEQEPEEEVNDIISEQSKLDTLNSKSKSVQANILSSKNFKSISSKIATISSIAVSPEPEIEEEPKPIEYTTIPGIWIPSNERTKASAMRYFFPAITNKYDLPEPEVTPPHLIVAFDAFKKKEVLELAAEYPNETMKMGFFTSCEPDNAQLITKTPERFDKIMVPPMGAKLIIQVSKKQSEPLLSYAILGPVYVSPNTVVGEKECEIFFPEGYDEVEIVEEEKSRKKTRKKKSSKTSKSDISGMSSDMLDEMSESRIEEEGMGENDMEMVENIAEEDSLFMQDDFNFDEPPNDLLLADEIGDSEQVPEQAPEQLPEQLPEQVPEQVPEPTTEPPAE